MPSSAQETNRKLVKFVPELESDFARYPMSHPRWLDPREKTPDNNPCFIKSESNAGPKADYVWGRGPFGHGYYHLLTQASYKNLYARLASEQRVGCCVCSKAVRKELDEFDDVRRLIYARSVARTPNDANAQIDAINQAKDTAQMWYNGTQNEQLAINIATTAARL